MLLQIYALTDEDLAIGSNFYPSLPVPSEKTRKEHVLDCLSEIFRIQYQSEEVVSFAIGVSLF